MCVVIAVYNEERYIARVLDALPEFVDQVIVVDDGSTDRTPTVVQGYVCGRATLVRLPENTGMGGAVTVGYKRALESEADIVVKMDGDGQMLPEFMSKLLDEVITHGYDYAKGNRLAESRRPAGMPCIRVIGNRLLSALTKFATGYWHIDDSENGYTAISSKALSRLPLDAMAKDMFFHKDILTHLSIAGRHVKDVPMPAVYGDERSTIRVWKILLFFPPRILHRFFFRVLRRRELPSQRLTRGLLLTSIWSIILGAGVGVTRMAGCTQIAGVSISSFLLGSIAVGVLLLSLSILSDIRATQR